MSYTRTDGFALPTILIASIVMLSVLVAAIQTVVVTRASLDGQHYTRLARQAAEAGLVRANQCISEANGAAPWSVAGNTLKPNTDCSGVAIGGASQYVIETSGYRTTFEIGSVTSSTGFMNITANAKTELLRKSDQVVWRVFNHTLHRNVNVASLVATTTAVGVYQVCGILDMKAWCWGDNDWGQLGDGTTTNSLTPVQVVRNSGALQGRTDTGIAIGYGHACTISSNEVWCWGRNNYGQLGNGTTTNSSVPVKVNTATGLSGKTLTQIVASEFTTCVLASADIYCWGDGEYGELGIGSFNVTRTSPAKVGVIGATATPTSRPVTKIATTPRAKHICAIASNRAYCWGGGTHGGIGDRTDIDKASPTAVYTGGALGTGTVTDIAVGGWDFGGENYEGHTCAIVAGNVYCWGGNTDGELGIGTSGSSMWEWQPRRVSTVLPAGQITQVAASYSSSCAFGNNTVWCWGANSLGQLGNNSTTNSSVPVAVHVGTPGLSGKTISNLIGGVERMCVVANISVYCWGNNDRGQIGDGTTVNRTTPTEAAFLRPTSPTITY